MVKRKQKVRWNKLGGLDWSCDEQVGTSNELPREAVKKLSLPGQSGRRRGSFRQTWSSVLAPRFERKAAEEAEQKKIYYEGELCETVELTNDFTKIRSKNLDILFKRDFYEQKMAAEFEALMKLKKLKNLDNSDEVSYEAFEEKQREELDVYEFELASVNESVVKSNNLAKFSCSFDQMDLDEIPEFKPLNSCLETSVHDQSQFQNINPPHSHHQEYLADQYSVTPRPTLYLYSPADNSFIPCEEIVIPNQVMSTESPVFSGSSNMYLAYPVHGPDGRGYITQPFNSSSDSFHSQDMSNSSHSMSLGQDSGFSTQPASPLFTVNCNTTNYKNEDFIHEVPPSINGYYGPPNTVEKSTTKPTNLDHSQSNITTPASASQSVRVIQISGLPSDSLATRRIRSKRGRKKKSNPEHTNHPDSASSDSEVLNFTFNEDSTSLKVDYDASLEDNFEEFIPVYTDEKELNLTDDLADSLVNPPTDPEVSEAEITRLKSPTNAQNYVQDGESTVSYISFCELMKNTLDEDLLNFEFKIQEVFNEDFIAVEPLSLVNFAAVHNNRSGIEVFDFKTSEKEIIEVKKDVECVNLQDRSEDLAKCIKSKCVEECLNHKQENCNNDVSLEKDIHKEIKKSYSSMIKVNLVTVSYYNSTCSQDHVKTCTISDPHISTTSCPPDNTMFEQESEHCWEKVPLSVSSPEKWENTSKKRKHKKKSVKLEDSPLPVEVHDLELDQEAAIDVLDILDKNLVFKEDVLEEEFVTTEKINRDKKKRRKRKKLNSEGHRVVICDEQIPVKYSQDTIQVSEVLSSSMLDMVKTLLVQDLGFGISRGCMNLGRLYRGYYVPPERTDGIFPELDCQEEEVIEEEIGGECQDKDCFISIQNLNHKQAGVCSN